MEKVNSRKSYITAVGIAWCILLASMLSGCGNAQKKVEEPAEPFIITLDGDEIAVGCTMQDLADAGYEFSDMSGKELVMDETGHTELVYAAVYDLSGEAEANTVYISIDLLKDMEKVAGITATNAQETSIPLAECIVDAISVYSTDDHSDMVTIEGISMEQLSVEALTEIYGEPASSTDNYIKWTRGDYALQLEYQDGELWNIRASYTGI